MPQDFKNMFGHFTSLCMKGLREILDVNPENQTFQAPNSIFDKYYLLTPTMLYLTGSSTNICSIALTLLLIVDF